MAVLDDPVGHALRGPHAHLARRRGSALGYHPDVSTFLAVPHDPTAAAWADLAALVGPGAVADLFSATATPPPTWTDVFAMDGVQLVGPTAGLARRDDGAVVELGAADVPAMLALARATRPGPFWERTRLMGTYLGIRDPSGRLVAMAGERLHPPGWTEVSAVCTTPEHRGRGLAARLVEEVAARVLERGERPFLHARRDNAGALRVYERLGFEVRREVTFRGFRTPADPTGPA
ncbi:FR47-like protein [Nocardioides scoriae]|uniref:FR47-like protein n=1 Tax=Nocardioides scoriae TaxID=642780 RepID=A0A1H1P5V3_9ACTN|nr:GNAT family N-acetyltransferase [Nocardioides scoriae]SDS06543.1 FR47-like protein [Nocardioides scoriae]